MNAMVPAPQAGTSQFEFSFDGHPVRGLMIGEKAVFVAADLARALRYRDAANLVRVVRPREKGTHTVSTLGGAQRLTTVTESGLYRAIMARKVADEKDVTLRLDIERFQDWVVEEVLPTIRRTGSYAPVPAPEPVDPMAFLSNPHNVMALIGQYAQRTIELEVQVARQGRDLQIAEHTIERQAVTVAAHDLLANADGSLCVTDVAKVLGLKPGALFTYMRHSEAKVRWFYKRSEKGPDVGIQDRLDAEELIEIPETVPVKQADGTVRDKMVVKLRVTPLGVTRLARLIIEGKDPKLPLPADMLKVLTIARDRHLFD
ncbi:phage antirepressor KilAC domain-containing protein [Methylorubrum sp. B1-46]|uniref:phage antirepressor n=1 Tax=Methylorubrum sp. B1-46 TaxID=2897334 RepID=UPI001E32C750|nr:phage antirepressor KilAC domain-containing protein [Methylorubrum sp. B1-46]UGB24778.1 phage antirepressor KilAC domain-containing protein [Methylorubrum sp. B1-46]